MSMIILGAARISLRTLHQEAVRWACLVVCCCPALTQVSQPHVGLLCAGQGIL